MLDRGAPAPAHVATSRAIQASASTSDLDLDLAVDRDRDEPAAEGPPAPHGRRESVGSEPNVADFTLIRSSAGHRAPADPLLAELVRSTPTRREPVPSIQRWESHDLGDVRTADEAKDNKAGPSFKAVTREGREKLDGARLKKLTDGIRLARAWVPQAIADVTAIKTDDVFDQVKLNDAFVLYQDAAVTAKAKVADKLQLDTGKRQDKATLDAWRQSKKVYATTLGAAMARIGTGNRPEIKRITEATKTAVTTTLGKIDRGLSQDQELVDVSADTDKSELGYVRPYSHLFRKIKSGRIHLRFSSLDTSPAEDVARLLVHEASHKYADTKDHAYFNDKSAVKAMTNDKARQNADSYAQYVRGFG